MCKDIDQLLCNFIWKNKTMFKKSVMMNNYNNGGLSLIDFRSYT